MCLCTTPMAKCVPSERAKSLGRLVFWIMIILTVVLIVGFVSGVTTEWLFTIGLVITGLCAVRTEAAFDIEQIMCVVFFSGYLWVFALVNLILYLTDGNSGATSLTAYFGGVVFYALSCYFAKQLYDELRINYHPPPPEAMGGGFFGGGPMGRMFGGGPPPQQQQGLANQGYQQGAYNQQPVGQGSGVQGNIPPYQASSQQQSSRKFQAFQGTGHTLS